MESKLDEIEEGDIEWKRVVSEFYKPLEEAIKEEERKNRKN